MNIKHIYGFYIAPLVEQKPIAQATLPLAGKLYKSIQRTFNDADRECKLPITFTPDNGTQSNSVRAAILDIIQTQKISSCKPLIDGLAKLTNQRSGACLVFIIHAVEGAKHKLLISRYKAEEAMVMNENETKLSVELIENAYLKKAYTYKGALYIGSNMNRDFWDGAIVDQQVNNGIKEVTNYWIKDFLQSDFKITSARGSRMAAKALKKAIADAEDVLTKQELMSAVVTMRTSHAQTISIESLLTQRMISSETVEAVRSSLESPELFDTNFVFDHDEFKAIANYKAVYLNTGGVLIADAAGFDRIITQTDIAGTDEKKFETTGKVINEEVRPRI